MSNKVNRNRGVVGYVCVRLFAVLIIVAVGIGFMFFTDNCCHLMAVGITYLIAMSAVMVVVLSDYVDAQIRQRLSAAT